MYINYLIETVKKSGKTLCDIHAHGELTRDAPSLNDVVQEEKEILSIFVCQKKSKERFPKRVGSEIFGSDKPV